MTSLQRVLITGSALLMFSGGVATIARADNSHARIVRLSVVEGDVRFQRDVKGDSLAANGEWDQAVENLPLRQGYALAMDNGRAVVEFEDGALAFLSENTVLEFYDLSSQDGGLTTRLILRQGSAEFYVSPRRGDYFSVTGGDFSVQAEGKTTFRMNNYDDGSDVQAIRGRLTVLAATKTTLNKGQFLSMKAGAPDSTEVGQASAGDEFDQWAAQHIESFNSATASASQYASGDDFDYVSGYGDLYTYGAWFPIGGYGNCWRPYGVGPGWSPFSGGSWTYETGLGWTFIGGQPWGWLPYHFGGWMFIPGTGWVWSPTGGGAGVGIWRWRPVTGSFVRSSNGETAIVPSHPLDSKGKTPINLSIGAFPVSAHGVSETALVASGQSWKLENNPGRDVLENEVAQVSAPERVSRTRTATSGAAARDSTIVYDPAEGRFVNGENSTHRTNGMRVEPESSRNGSATSREQVPNDRNSGREGDAAPSARSVVPPPNVPRSVTVERGATQFYDGGGSHGGSGPSSSVHGSSGGSGGGASAGSASHTSGGGSSASAGAGAGGGRPH